jgi:hypothetical protein
MALPERCYRRSRQSADVRQHGTACTPGRSFVTNAKRQSTAPQRPDIWQTQLKYDDDHIRDRYRGARPPAAAKIGPVTELAGKVEVDPRHVRANRPCRRRIDRRDRRLLRNFSTLVFVVPNINDVVITSAVPPRCFRHQVRELFQSMKSEKDFTFRTLYLSHFGFGRKRNPINRPHSARTPRGIPPSPLAHLRCPL